MGTLLDITTITINAVSYISGLAGLLILISTIASAMLVGEWFRRHSGSL